MDFCAICTKLDNNRKLDVFAGFSDSFQLFSLKNCKCIFRLGDICVFFAFLSQFRIIFLLHLHRFSRKLYCLLCINIPFRYFFAILSVYRLFLHSWRLHNCDVWQGTPIMIQCRESIIVFPLQTSAKPNPRGGIA